MHDPDLTRDKLTAIFSHNALDELKNKDPDDLKKTLELGKRWNSQMARNDNSLDVELDIDLKQADPKSEGSDATGYWVKLGIPDIENTRIFVVKENGIYKILGTGDDSSTIGLEILDRIHAGDLQDAKILLDWLREDRHLEGGDDPLGGPLFPRFWTKGEAANARKMKLAAAALLVFDKFTAPKGILLLNEEQKQASGEREKTNILLALTMGYAMQNDYAHQLEFASALLRQEPESKFAFNENAVALLSLGRYDDTLALANERLKLLDNDQDALTMKMEAEVMRGNYAAARGWVQKLVDQGKEDASLLNSSAWFALFTGKVEESDIAMAIKATQLAKDNAAILHTLACLYAEAGKTKEAHDMLLRGMDELNLDEPDEDYWYAFGRIAEQYGEREIALADYRKLKMPKEPLSIPTSTYRLAQMRLKALHAEEAIGK
jgi:tetratricopeptide (TPR) repeat protein